jgi:hypothetical protein
VKEGITKEKGDCPFILGQPPFMGKEEKEPFIFLEEGEAS